MIFRNRFTGAGYFHRGSVGILTVDVLNNKTAPISYMYVTGNGYMK